MVRWLRRWLLRRRTLEAGRQRQAWGALLSQGQETTGDGDDW